MTIESGGGMTNPTEQNGAETSQLTVLLQRLQFISPYDWRESAFSPELDALLAELALDQDRPEVAEAAARAIGRIRSEAAVKVLAEQQRSGESGALRALALVRDEAPSLPKSVSRQARMYTWLTNTWRRLTLDPLHAVWRYLFAAIFAGIAVWWYAYSELNSAAIFFAERWGKSITSGITFGVVFGLVVLFAAEVPERLRGFWPWWGRLILNLVLGILTGVFVWLVFTWFFLFIEPQSSDLNTFLLGGLGAALAFSLGVVFRIPGWLGALWAAVMIFIPLYLTWTNYMPPLVYVRPGETIEQYAIPMSLLIGIGAYFQQILGEIRALVGRLRRPASTPVQPAPASS